MMTRKWAALNSTGTWKVSVEEYSYKDGSLHYSFRDRFGRPSDVDHDEAMEIIKNWKMTDITEQMKEEGWIL